MTSQSITITLPEPLYERLQLTAKAAALSVEQALTESLALCLPALEPDLPFNRQLTLAQLSVSNDLHLWQAAHATMPAQRQARLAELADWLKHRALTPSEQNHLDELMDEAHHLMLCKAEARRLLAQRGHIVFATPE